MRVRITLRIQKNTKRNRQIKRPPKFEQDNTNYNNDSNRKYIGSDNKYHLQLQRKPRRLALR